MADLVAWNAAMAWETERKRLDPEILRRGDAGVAVGSLLVTFEWSDWRGGDFWWIQSVYVDPAARRGGVFRALYAAVGQRAAAAGAVGLRLYVETENRRAQQTYEGLGMQRCHYWMYEAMLTAAADR